MFAAIGGLLLALAPPAPAPAVELRWDAPEQCPQQPALVAEVAALLADHVPPEQPTPPRLHFRVERRGARWHLHGEITSTGLTGQRELDGSTCEELLAAAALLAAIVVDPSGTSQTPEPPAPALVPAPARPTPVPPPVVRPPTPPPEAAATRKPATRPRPGAQLGLAAGLGLGALPRPAGLLRLTLGLRGRAWSLALVQDLWLPRDGYVPGSPEVGGRLWMWSAGLRGCGLVRAGKVVELPMCAAVSLGAMTGRAVGAVSQSFRQTSPWGGATLGPGLRVALRRRLGLVFSADLLVVFARPRFEISGHGQACCDDLLGGQFTGGVELRLP